MLVSSIHHYAGAVKGWFVVGTRVWQSWPFWTDGTPEKWDGEIHPCLQFTLDSWDNWGKIKVVSGRGRFANLYTKICNVMVLNQGNPDIKPRVGPRVEEGKHFTLGEVNTWTRILSKPCEYVLDNHHIWGDGIRYEKENIVCKYCYMKVMLAYAYSEKWGVGKDVSGEMFQGQVEKEWWEGASLSSALMELD